MKNNDLVTIIVPVYNTPQKQLLNCINHLLSQTYENLEILIIDDGSVEKTKRYCDKLSKLDSRIIVYHQQNNGPSSARNRGINMANGRYYCFCDADDWYETNYVEVMYNAIKKDNCDIVRCSYSKVFDNNKKIKVNTKLVDVPSKKIIKKFLCPTDNDVTYVTLLMIKNNKKKRIYFNENLKYMEDLVFYIENLLVGNKLNFIDDNLYNHSFNDFSITNSFRSNEKLDKILITRTELEKILNKYENDNLLAYFDCHIIRLVLWNLDTQCIKMKNYKKFSEQFDSIYDKIIEQINLKNINTDLLGKISNAQVYLFINHYKRLLFLLNLLKNKIKKVKDRI